MRAASRSPLLSWTVIAPAFAAAVLAATWGRDLPGVLVVLVAMVLAGAVLAAVQHAEVVAHYVGEPMGSLVLAIAVTVIEVALIVTLMVSGGKETGSLARDTVFAAAMITCNGIVGLSLLLGALRHGITRFNAEGSGAALATVATLATLSLVLPKFTTSVPGPEYSSSQLAFAAAASLSLYGMFVLTQTVRHRDLFVPVSPDGAVIESEGDAPAPSKRETAAAAALLLIALVGVVGLAKVESPAIESAVEAAGFPQSFVGVVIALLVLLPETLAAVARRSAGRGPDEPEPRLRLRDGKHRADHPDHRRCNHLARRATRARPRLDADGAAGVDRRRRRAHGGAGSSDPAARRRSPRRARGVSVPRRQPVAQRCIPAKGGHQVRTRCHATAIGGLGAPTSAAAGSAGAGLVC